jgi:LmbE family N-acetylglucosaminyl deacetylase
MTENLLDQKPEINSSKDNVAEYLQQNNIKNITFVFAHPDDLEGYAAGLFSNLMKMNGLIDPSTIKLIVATNGAGGVKNEVDRLGIVETRMKEQLASLESLGWEFAQTNTKFLGLEDGDIDSDALNRALEIELGEGGPDLIITHDDNAWGHSSNSSPEETDEYVQNHPDHRACANSVDSVIKGRDVKVLKATWDGSEAKIISEYAPGVKINSFKYHQSQYSQNHGSMDLIENKLNRVGDKRFEYFKESRPENTQNEFKATLLSGLGRALSNDMPMRRLEQVITQNGIRSADAILEVDEQILKKTLIETIRNNGIDVLLLKTLNVGLLKIIDKVMMFEASVAVQGVQGAPRPVRMFMYPDEQGDLLIDEKRYRFVKGLW